MQDETQGRGQTRLVNTEIKTTQRGQRGGDYRVMGGLQPLQVVAPVTLDPRHVRQVAVLGGWEESFVRELLDAGLPVPLAELPPGETEAFLQELRRLGIPGSILALPSWPLIPAAFTIGALVATLAGLTFSPLAGGLGLLALAGAGWFYKQSQQRTRSRDQLQALAERAGSRGDETSRALRRRAQSLTLRLLGREELSGLILEDLLAGMASWNARAAALERASAELTQARGGGAGAELQQELSRQGDLLASERGELIAQLDGLERSLLQISQQALAEAPAEDLAAVGEAARRTLLEMQGRSSAG